MAVKIRLKRMGSKKNPFYRIVSTDSRNPRDGRFIETLGYYNPMRNPAQLKFDEASVFKWLERGAIPTPSAESLLRKVGIMQKWQLLKQGVKREDLDSRLEAMGIKTTLQTVSKKSKKAAKAKEAAAGAEDKTSLPAEGANNESAAASPVETAEAETAPKEE